MHKWGIFANAAIACAETGIKFWVGLRLQKANRVLAFAENRQWIRYPSMLDEHYGEQCAQISKFLIRQ